METGDGLYLLQRDRGYKPIKLPTRGGWLDYDIDRLRKRLYYHDGGYNYSYLDLRGPKALEESVNFLPKSMKIITAAPDGSSLILSKWCWDDIYIEENRNFPKDCGAEAPPEMLFRYDLGSGEIDRLTYFYSQSDAWLTPDGECLAYRRHEYHDVISDGWCTTIIFCRADGKLKYDLRPFFKEGGVDLSKIGFNFEFAPKVGYEFNGEKYYYAVFRPERRHGDEVKGPGTLEYYYAKLKYEADELNCEIVKKFIDVPEGTVLGAFCSEPSNEKELYFWGYVEGEDGGIIRYDVYDDTFYAIPHTGVFLSFLVY
jgi:hypothetical protein